MKKEKTICKLEIIEEYNNPKTLYSVHAKFPKRVHGYIGHWGGELSIVFDEAIKMLNKEHPKQNEDSGEKPIRYEVEAGDENLYKLLKDYEDPNGKIYKDVVKTRHQWCSRFALLTHADLDTKTDWFKKVKPHQVLSPEQVEAVIVWMRTWEHLQGTVIPVRFEEDFGGKHE